MKSINSVVSKRKIRGQGMTEYIIIVALIAIAAIGVFTAFGGTIRNQVAGMAAELSGTDAGTQLGRATAQAALADGQSTKAQGLNAYNGNAVAP